MKSRACILVIVFVISAVSASSQESRKTINDRRNREVSLITASPETSADLNRTVTSGGGFHNIPLGEKSSLYLNDDFTQGTIYLSDGSDMENIPLRYDVYHQQIQFIQKEDTLAIANPVEVRKISFDDRQLVYHSFEIDQVVDTGIFELLIDGRCKLFIRHKVDYHITAESPEEEGYIKSSDLFIAREGRPAVELNANRRAVCHLFSDREEEVKEFIKSNHLKMSKYDDVMLVVEFYNSIEEN